MRWAWEEESAWFGGDRGGLQGEGAMGAQASRQLGPEHVSSNPGKLGVRGGEWPTGPDVSAQPTRRPHGRHTLTQLGE